MILIVDDDAAIRSSLSFLLKRTGFDTEAVSTPEEALSVVRQSTPQLILMDMNFSMTTTGAEGIQLLRQVKVFCPDVPVILITAWGSIPLAVQGMHAGAFDFITKPWDNMMLVNSIKTALELSEKKHEAETPLTRLDVEKNAAFKGIIGNSDVLMEILGMVLRIAPTNASVLITGESGTGKELIAEAIHANSKRKKEAFVKVNLGGLSQSLFESEMFGHKKGAFTDAYIDRTGRFEMADKGTIFLDEIGELEQSCQVKLLRVLQDQTFEVLGDSRPRKVDIRVVSATNRSLPDMVASNLFREDLFYRINLISIHVPALRERREDIPLLARHFANKLVETNGLKGVDFTSEALTFLQRLSFPGNIRELRNLVERTILVSGKNLLDTADFESETDASALSQKISASASGMTLDEAEKQRILHELEKYSGNITKMAVALGLSRAALYRRMEKYNISTEK
jgi:Response regulator containing CheY-like receiver, AAA-type ATPase, and DNA-binding domains